MEFAVYASLALALVAVALCVLILLKVGRPATIPEDLSTRIAVLEQVAKSLPDTLRDESRTGREELRGIFGTQTEALETRFSAVETRLSEFGKAQTEQLSGMRTEAADGRAKLEEAVQRNAEGFATTQSERLKETNDGVRSLSDRLLAAQRDGREEQRVALEGVTGKVGQLIETNDKRQEALRQTVADGLDKMRVDNADKLEKMRATVEEKLQGTLEKRLGESFQLVSDRLEQVHKGLGEMQNLATGVGDLKRVLSNVKSRGGWGEVQLGMLLEDMLTKDQFATNVRVRPESGEVVEYAVRLPGRGEDETPLWLPIDAKFPHEDYDRLLLAQEGDGAEPARVALRQRLVRAPVERERDRSRPDHRRRDGRARRPGRLFRRHGFAARHGAEPHAPAARSGGDGAALAIRSDRGARREGQGAAFTAQGRCA